MSEVLTEILRVDPTFDKDRFLHQCETDIIPNILEVRTVPQAMVGFWPAAPPPHLPILDGTLGMTRDYLRAKLLRLPDTYLRYSCSQVAVQPGSDVS